jgi:thymidine kinase
VWQLARAVDDLQLPVMAYGLRVDFQGELFAGVGQGQGQGQGQG